MAFRYIVIKQLVILSALSDKYLRIINSIEYVISMT